MRTLNSTPQIPPVQLAPEPVASMSFNAGEQIAAFNGSSVTHDPDGNMTNGPLPSGTFGSYAFDFRNRLQSAGGLTYSYDAEGNRIGTGGTETQSFAVDPHGEGLPRILARTKNSQTTRYVYGLGLLYEVDSSGQAIYYHYDQIGNTVALTNQSGGVGERIVYAPYGTIRYRQSGFDTPFLYGGSFGVMTDANGLLYMRARYYNPLSRRFLNSDPARDGWNWYSYATGNPITFNDPAGLDAYFGYNDAHAWAAVDVDVPKGKIAKYDFYQANWQGSSGNNLKDLLEYGSGQGKVTVDVFPTLDVVINNKERSRDTIYRIPTSPEQDRQIFKRMIADKLNQPRYNAALYNCGQSAIGVIFGNIPPQNRIEVLSADEMKVSALQRSPFPSDIGQSLPKIIPNVKLIHSPSAPVSSKGF